MLRRVHERSVAEDNNSIGDGVVTDVIGPPPGELFSETNDNSVPTLLAYGTARVLFAVDA